MGKAPTTVANCLADEVAVPDVRGMTPTQAEGVLQASCSSGRSAATPAARRAARWIVTAQSPASGVLSAYPTVQLVLPRPRHGVVPDLVGLSLERARARLARCGCTCATTRRGGRVVSQHPAAGVARGRA